MFSPGIGPLPRRGARGHGAARTSFQLDQSLVRDLGENERSREIVAAVVHLAKRLGMAVTGEGIETAEHLAMLRDLDCDWGQGFFLAPPLPPEELAAFLQTGVVPSPPAEL